MLACEGYVENGQFHPIGALTRTPTRLRAFLTILDEPVNASRTEDCAAFWSRFDKMAAASANEVLREDDFPRMKIGREPVAI